MQSVVDMAASVWPLIAVADWVGGVLAEMMRSVISARGQLEWTDGVLSTDSELSMRLKHRF